MNDLQKSELDRLAKEGGGLLKAEVVLETARDPANPLHSEFEWNDGTAATKYRMQQARQLIRVHTYLEPSLHRVVRGFVSVPTDRALGGGYRSTPNVLNNPAWQESIVQEVMKRITSLKQSYSFLGQLDPLWERLNATLVQFLEEAKAQKQVG